MGLILPVAYFLANGIQDSTESEAVASRVGLTCASTKDGSVSGATLWKVVTAVKPPKAWALVGVLLLAVSEVGSLFGFTFGVASPDLGSGNLPLFVRVVPDYWDGGTIAGIVVFLLLAQTFFCMGAVMCGLAFYVVTSNRLGAVDRLVTNEPAHLDMRRCDNVVLWCRLRDHARRSLNGGPCGYFALSTVTSISVTWAILSGALSIFCFYMRADWTPFRAICAWYALVGGAAATLQLFALYHADKLVKSTHRMLEAQLEKVNLETNTLWQHDASGAGALQRGALQSAANALDAELKVYRHTPWRRGFSIFGVPVGQVLAPILSLVVGQGVTYGWTWLRQEVSSDTRDHMGNCTIFLEFHECAGGQ